MPLKLLGTIASSVQKSSNSYESIATLTGNGSATTLTFDSIPSTYKHLQVRFSLLINTGGVNLPKFRINNDATSNYIEHRLSGTGAAVSAAAITGNQELSMYANAPGGDATNPTVGVLDILDYADTNKYKTTRMLIGCDKNGSGGIDLRSGLWFSTSAISRLDFFTQSSYEFKSGTTIALYGIKGA
jgi:hypothetical protein